VSPRLKQTYNDYVFFYLLWQRANREANPDGGCCIPPDTWLGEEPSLTHVCTCEPTLADAEVHGANAKPCFPIRLATHTKQSENTPAPQQLTMWEGRLIIGSCRRHALPTTIDTDQTCRMQVQRVLGAPASFV